MFRDITGVIIISLKEIKNDAINPEMTAGIISGKIIFIKVCTGDEPISEPHRIVCIASGAAERTKRKTIGIQSIECANAVNPVVLPPTYITVHKINAIMVLNRYTS